MARNADVVRRLFAAVERRDLPAMLACYDPDVEIREAESLPYGGVHRGHDGARRHAAAFMASWGALQPPADRSLDAELVAGPGDTVVAIFRHRATDPATQARFDAPEVGLYSVRHGKVTHAQMFHADTAAVVEFLRAAHSDPRRRGP
jgi:ketosteroid isomerase-like protein